jgi:hypothetical protein
MEQTLEENVSFSDFDSLKCLARSFFVHLHFEFLLLEHINLLRKCHLHKKVSFVEAKMLLFFYLHFKCRLLSLKHSLHKK